MGEVSRLITGISVPNSKGGDDVVNLLENARSDSFDFVSTNLPHTSTCHNRTDVTQLESRWWSTSIIGKMTSPPVYVQQRGTSENAEGEAIVEALCNANTNSSLASLAEDHLSFMLEWAGHMNIPAVICPPIPHQERCNPISYYRFLSSQCLKASANNIQLWVRVPFTEEGLNSFRDLHKMCDGPANLGCMISLDSSNAPSTDDIGQSLTLLHHFCGCNLRAICFNTDAFLTNKKGYPTMSKTCQFVFTELLKRLGRTVRVLVDGEIRHHNDDHATVDVRGQSGYLSYVQYIRHLRSKGEVASVLDTEDSRMELDYLDHLQSALQPCFDNLEFGTYEVFEKDPVKYVNYQEAIECALEDKIEHGQLLIENDSFPTFLHAVILVVGAGRGPLVKASLNAISNINKRNSQAPPSSQQQRISASSSGGSKNNNQIPMIKAKIIAIEKNPSAVVFLHSLKCSNADWSSVDIIECDMRYAHKNETLSKMITGEERNRADIVVSELLGSFGDNEVSPECLDGVQNSGLMKQLCVNIPQSYTSYLAPTASMRLHAETQAQSYQPSNAMDGPYGKPSGTLTAMETPYVVRSHAASQMHKELPCWAFSHPIQRENVSIHAAAEGINNERHAELNFIDDFSSAVGYRSGYGSKDKTIENIVCSMRDESDEKSSYTLHGFLGTFHCLLYQTYRKKSITISIAPNSFSVGMYSWFPLYFPLREPLIVPGGAMVRCNIWRKSDANASPNQGGSVWYEWYAEVIDKRTDKVISASNLHNPCGRSCKILL